MNFYAYMKDKENITIKDNNTIETAIKNDKPSTFVTRLRKQKPKIQYNHIVHSL